MAVCNINCNPQQQQQQTRPVGKAFSDSVSVLLFTFFPTLFLSFSPSIFPTHSLPFLSYLSLSLFLPLSPSPLLCLCISLTALRFLRFALLCFDLAKCSARGAWQSLGGAGGVRRVSGVGCRCTSLSRASVKSVANCVVFMPLHCIE